ncbi:MAG: DsbA family protein [Leptospiraceae bacterium]|nr:DsbA family protein [Leptospiraceae bacterium]
MDKIKFLLIGTLLVFFVYLGFSLPAVSNYYLPENYVIIGGKKFTERDLKNLEFPQYLSARKNYNNELQNVFYSFATHEMLRQEAKQLGVEPEQVLNQGTKNYSPPEEEIMAVYDAYKSQLQGKKYEEVREQIVDFLIQQKKNEYKNQLAKKYEISVHIEKPPRIQVEEKNNPALGPNNAKVTIIEFSDFECPYCQRSQSTNTRLREKYKDQIRWVFRDYPLPFHSNAMFAHIAANCAYKQNKFWELFPLLFGNTGNLARENVLELSKKVDLDQSQFQECIADKDNSVRNEIQSDIQDGQKAGVNGTPAFFVNGIFVEGAQPYEVFERIIEDELKK